MIKITGASLLVIAIIVLAYGYRYGKNHGSLYVMVMDVSDREHPKDIRSVELSFLDSSGNVLAQAAGTEESGAIFVSLPKVYSCRELEERATLPQGEDDWARCFERQSRWLTTWVRNVKSVDIRSRSCTIHRMPISVSEHGDTWWLWWVPLRHIGGKPYTFFSFTITFDGRSCA